MEGAYSMNWNVMGSTHAGITQMNRVRVPMKTARIWALQILVNEIIF